MIGLVYPATATIFFGQLMELLTLQFYDFTDIYNRILLLSPDSEGNNPLCDLFYTMGYKSLYIIQNFGTLCWTIFIAPVLWLISLVVARLFGAKFAWFATKCKNLMFYDAWVTFFNDTLLFLAVCAGLNFYYFRFNTFGDAINSLCAIIFGGTLLVYSVLQQIFYSLRQNYARILNGDTEFSARFGSSLP